MLIFDCKLICEEKSCGLPQLKEETQNIMIVSFLWCFFSGVSNNVLSEELPFKQVQYIHFLK